MSLPADIRDFLNDYPNNNDSGEGDEKPNFEFYSNTLKCQPDNLLIDRIHERWTGDYLTLERKHGYIQWLSA